MIRVQNLAETAGLSQREMFGLLTETRHLQRTDACTLMNAAAENNLY